MISFTGTCFTNVIRLQWATATETNNDYFTIEKSADGINWDILGKINGAGNSSHTLNYSFEDDKPLGKTNYYRIKQTDFNGQYKYSELISVENCFNASQVYLYPNPARDEVTVEVSAYEDGISKLEITDLLGKIIRRSEERRVGKECRL